MRLGVGRSLKKPTRYRPESNNRQFAADNRHGQATGYIGASHSCIMISNPAHSTTLPALRVPETCVVRWSKGKIKGHSVGEGQTQSPASPPERPVSTQYTHQGFSVHPGVRARLDNATDIGDERGFHLEPWKPHANNSPHPSCRQGQWPPYHPKGGIIKFQDNLGRNPVVRNLNIRATGTHP